MGRREIWQRGARWWYARNFHSISMVISFLDRFDPETCTHDLLIPTRQPLYRAQVHRARTLRLALFPT